MPIYDKKKLNNRTYIEQVIALYDMGSELEEQIDTKLSGKQDTLVSGSNIKTINGKTILGRGNLNIIDDYIVDSELSTTSEYPVQNKVITNALGTKQEVLVNGENIKTVLNAGVLGAGNLSLEDLGLPDIQATNVIIEE